MSKPILISQRERYVVTFYSDDSFPEQGVIAPPASRFYVLQQVPFSGKIKRFFIQFPDGANFRVSARLCFEQKPILPIEGLGWITLNDSVYDNQHVSFPVTSGDRLNLEVINSQGIEQELFALIEISPKVPLHG